MKKHWLYATAAAVAAVTASPAFAATFTIDFEKNWDYLNGDINNYYNGGTAADGSSGGPNLGVSFTNVSGLSNDANFTYYTGAPSPVGIAYAHDTAYMNVAAGVDGATNALQFFYSSTADVTGAIKAYSGANGTGTLLGSVNVVTNTAGSPFDAWTLATLSFNGVAKSFDLSGLDNVGGIDNVSVAPVPLPAGILLFGSGLLTLAGFRRKAA